MKMSSDSHNCLWHSRVLQYTAAPRAWLYSKVAMYILPALRVPGPAPGVAWARPGVENDTVKVPRSIIGHLRYLMVRVQAASSYLSISNKVIYQAPYLHVLRHR